jgi:hypothetical protein
MRLDPGTLPRDRPSELVELLRLGIILAYVDARLVLLPQSRNRAWIFRQGNGKGSTPCPARLRRISRIAELLRTAARFRLRSASPCLCLALTLRISRAPLGLRASLVCGARRLQGAVEAHAWLLVGAARIDPYGTSRSFKEFERI